MYRLSRFDPVLTSDLRFEAPKVVVMVERIRDEEEERFEGNLMISRVRTSLGCVYIDPRAKRPDYP